MKKVLTGILVFCLLLGITGCTPVMKSTDTNTVSKNNTTTSKNVSTNSTASKKECSHSWSTATCKSPQKCSKCGETKGTTIDHKYVDGKCSFCGVADPAKAEITKILSDCERYATYIDLEADILENTLDLYKMNRKPSLLVEMQESVNKIDEYYSKIRKYCEPRKHELYVLYTECDREMPVFTSTSTAKLATYITQASRLKSAYDATCESWGVK